MRLLIFLLLSSCASEAQRLEPSTEPSASASPPAATSPGGCAAVPSGTATGAPGPPPLGPWPEGKRAAITLTYDDGLDGQLKYALPALDARSLKGTFYLSSFQGVPHNWALPDLETPLTPRHLAWAAAAATGHELAGHTVYHPCASNNAGFQPQDYDLTRMAEELDDSLLRLGRLGAVAPFSFAYPCETYDTGIAGGSSFVPLVQERFFAARVSQQGIADPASVDLQHIPQRSFNTDDGAELIAAAKQTLELGHWLVLSFHGIGPEQTCDITQFDLTDCALNYLTTSEQAHLDLLDYLAGEPQLWVAPMNVVGERLATER